MNTNRWASHRFLLYFLDSAVESRYRSFILERAMVFTRVTWVMVIFLTVSFSILDNQYFGEAAWFVRVLRALIIVVALLAQYFSLKEKYSRLMDWNGFVFVLMLGVFCNVAMLLDTTEQISIYFTGLFLIFPGIFCTAGLGYRYSFWAFLLTMVVFDVMFGLMFPMGYELFLAYNVFLGGLVFVYVYLGYLVERIFRKNFITSEELKQSLSEVHQLSGMLPICAHCKKIRDDSGYWNQIESYIEKHSKAAFSHGLCPDCSDELYGHEEWYTKRKQAG